MPSLPLLRVPFLAQKVILGQMTPMDLFQLSHTSKRVERIMKFSAMKNLKLELCFNGKENYPEFCIKRDNVSYNFYIRPTERLPGDQQFNIWESNVRNICWITFVIFCNDVQRQTKIIVEYFRRVFDMKLSSLDLSHIDKHTFKLITDSVIAQQTEIDTMKLRHIGGPALDITELLKNVKTEENLWVASKLKSTFGFNFANVPKTATFQNATWFTRHTLLNSEWEILLVTGALLTNKAIDDFVEQWMQGNFPKLKHVTVVSKKFQNKTTVAGRVPPIFQARVLPFRWREARTWGVNVDVNVGINITNRNGVTAKFGFQGGAKSIFFLHVSY
ncbi:hypothetical protein CAEBREN_26236 [Caenorhabditis brenneri]|uniref:F-box domain-containing protein n=1 Tax=Caenorhabditis brenneri TaxID=135651 RepID=G0N7V4_CAEBE|nr:hypothetical protein CAEBREN_26236 [Caenorhabditis brenneri]